jgi:hypothetical protein
MAISIEDERAIIALLVRYATAIDRRDWALFATCFTQDVEADYGAITRCTDRDTLVEFMRRGHAKIGATLHRMSNFVIDGDAEGATATSYVDALLMHADGKEILRQAHGWYEDRLVSGRDGWRIARRRFVPVLIQEPRPTAGRQEQ